MNNKHLIKDLEKILDKYINSLFDTRQVKSSYNFDTKESHPNIPREQTVKRLEALILSEKNSKYKYQCFHCGGNMEIKECSHAR